MTTKNPFSPAVPPTGAVVTVPPEVRQQVNEVFADFVGNHAAIETLKRVILKARMMDPPQLPINYLFTGNPSTGKTELARRVARCLHLPFVPLDGRGLVTRERLFDLIDGELRDSGQRAIREGSRLGKPLMHYPPLVVFIDEIHLVPNGIQESLLTALEPRDRSVLLADRVALVPQVTFVFRLTGTGMSVGHKSGRTFLPFPTRWGFAYSATDYE